MLLLESIEIHNFRGIENGRVEGLAEVNVFVGRNNSGKSTVVEAVMRAGRTEVDGPHLVQYELSLAGDEGATLRAGDSVELEIETVKNPVTGAEVHPRAVLPEGLVFKDGALLASKRFVTRGSVAYDHSGRYAAIAPFEYSDG